MRLTWVMLLHQYKKHYYSFSSKLVRKKTFMDSCRKWIVLLPWRTLFLVRAIIKRVWQESAYKTKSSLTIQIYRKSNFQISNRTEKLIAEILNIDIIERNNRIYHDHLQVYSMVSKTHHWTTHGFYFALHLRYFGENTKSRKVVMIWC